MTCAGVLNATEMAQFLTRTGRLGDLDCICVEETHASDGMLSAWGVLWSKLTEDYRLRAQHFVKVAMRGGDVKNIPGSFMAWDSLSPYEQLLFSIGLSYYLS